MDFLKLFGVTPDDCNDPEVFQRVVVEGFEKYLNDSGGFPMGGTAEDMNNFTIILGAHLSRIGMAYISCGTQTFPTEEETSLGESVVMLTVCRAMLEANEATHREMVARAKAAQADG